MLLRLISGVLISIGRLGSFLNLSGFGFFRVVCFLLVDHDGCQIDRVPISVHRACGFDETGEGPFAEDITGECFYLTICLPTVENPGCLTLIDVEELDNLLEEFFIFDLPSLYG